MIVEDTTLNEVFRTIIRMFALLLSVSYVLPEVITPESGWKVMRLSHPTSLAESGGNPLFGSYWKVFREPCSAY